MSGTVAGPPTSVGRVVDSRRQVLSVLTALRQLASEAVAAAGRPLQEGEEMPSLERQVQTLRFMLASIWGGGEEMRCFQ